MSESNPTRPDGQSWDPRLYDRHSFVWQQGESLLGLLEPQPGKHVLDLGCGTGQLTARIAEAGASVVGLDSSAEMLEQARSAYPYLEFVRGDARDFRFPRPFDAVFSNAVLHWIKEPAAVARCVRECLRPGGRFVAELGGRGNVAAVLAALREAANRFGVCLDEPLWYFPGVGEYAVLLEEAGLEVRFATLFDRPTPLEGEAGLRDWLRMFAGQVLDRIEPGKREAFLRSAEEAARPALFRDGRWVADYRRLRIVAGRP
jgi:trans-aconitate 2-methyltransferase